MQRVKMLMHVPVFFHSSDHTSTFLRHTQGEGEPIIISVANYGLQNDFRGVLQKCNKTPDIEKFATSKCVKFHINNIKETSFNHSVFVFNIIKLLCVHLIKTQVSTIGI